MGRSFFLTGKSFLLTVGLRCLRSIGLVFCTYGFFLRVEIRFGLFYLRFPSPPPEIRFGLYAYGSTHPEIGLGLFAYGCPTVSKKRRAISKQTSIVSKKDASYFLIQSSWHVPTT